jgi:hypothetical protein
MKYYDGGFYSWAFAPSCRWELPTSAEVIRKRGW